MKEDFSNNELEKRLRAAADRFALTPSDQVWAGISSQLHPRRKRRFWLWAAAAILALSLGSYFILHQNKARINNHGQVANLPKTPEKITPSVPTDEKIEKDSNPIVHAPDGLISENGRHTEKKESLPEKTIVRSNPKVIMRGVPGKDKSSAENLPFPYYRLPLLTSQGLTAPLPVQTQIGMAEMPGRLMNTNEQITSVPYEVNIPQAPDQKIKEGKNKKRHITYEAFLISGVGYRALNVHSGNFNTDQMANPGNQQMVNSMRPLAIVPQKEKMEQHPDLSYSAGVNVAFPLGSHYTIKTGLSVMSVGYNISAFETYPAYIRDNGTISASNYAGANSFYSQSTVAAAVQKRSNIHNRYLYGEIPALVSREFGAPEKVHFRIGAGGGLLYMLKSSPVIYYPESGRYFTDKNLLRQLNADFHLEGEMIIPLTKKLNFTIGPSLQYQILSSYKDYPGVAEHPYFPGIKAGLQWKK